MAVPQSKTLTLTRDARMPRTRTARSRLARWRFCAAQDWADYPIFALAAAVIATDLTPARSRELGFRRLVAPAIGGLSGSALAASMNFVGIWAVGQSMIAMFICQAYEGARIAGYICGIIVLLDTGDIPWRYAFFGRSRPRSAFSWRGDSTRECDSLDVIGFASLPSAKAGCSSAGNWVEAKACAPVATSREAILFPRA